MSSLDHPSMRRRMQRREEMLGIAMASAAAVPPPEQQVNKHPDSPGVRCGGWSSRGRSPNEQRQQQPTLRRGMSCDTLAPSFVSSVCSEPSILTDYGLHRAVTAPVVVPNEQNPIATIKDRKNARYIENMTARHAVLKRELDESISAFNEVTASRDDNKSVKLQDMLNRKFLDANNSLACRSREYSVFLHDIKELQDMPKMGRDEMYQRYTVHKAKERSDRENNDSPDVQYQMHEIQQQIAGLELEREDLIKRTGAVNALAEQVAYVEHLNQSLRGEHEQILKRFASKERLCEQHTAAVDQLTEDIAYYERLDAQQGREIAQVLQRNVQVVQKNTQISQEYAEISQENAEISQENAQISQENAQISQEYAQIAQEKDQIAQEYAQMTQDLDAATRANRMLQHDLEVQRNHAADVCKQLSTSHTDIRNLHGQLGFAKSTATQLKDQNRALHQDVRRLHELCQQARDETDDLHDEVDRLAVERERMLEIRELQRENNAHLREEFVELHGFAVRAKHQAVSSAEKLQAELARARAGAARRDSVVSDSSTPLGARRSASA